MMDDTLTVQNPPKSPDLASRVIDFRPPPNNTIQVVATPKQKKTKKDNPKKNLPYTRANLIKLTEKLAEDAKSGKLTGLGGFAIYEDGTYDFGLEGSCLVDPTSTALPLKRLEWRIMHQIEAED